MFPERAAFLTLDGALAGGISWTHEKNQAPTFLGDDKSQASVRGYPVGTVALYGPTADLATKIVVSVVKEEGEEPDLLERWFSDGSDIRRDPAIERKIATLFREHPVLTVVTADRILGCPHEEGVDYPEGTSCPQCTFWAGRDRFTHERIH